MRALFLIWLCIWAVQAEQSNLDFGVFGTSLEPLHSLNERILSQFGSRSIEAVFIAQGAADNVLPVLGLAQELVRDLPWLRVSRFATYEGTGLQDVVHETHMEFCPFVLNVIHFDRLLRNDLRQSRASWHWNPAKNAMVSGEMMVQANAASIQSVLGNAQVIFISAVNPRCRVQDNPIFRQRLKALGERLVIAVDPAYLPTLVEAALRKDAYHALRGMHLALQDETSLAVGQRIKSRVKQDAVTAERFANGLPSDDTVAEAVALNRLTGALKPIPTLLGLSSLLLPAEERLPQHTIAVGPWFERCENDDGGIPAELKLELEFMETSKPWVYIGFGSMTRFLDASVQRTICSTIEALSPEFRFIWHTPGIPSSAGMPGLKAGAKCLKLAYRLDAKIISQPWLFQRMQAVVHQGTLSTTHAAVYAGTISIILPQIRNAQWLMSYMVTQLGLGFGLPSLPTALQLRQAILSAVGSPSLRSTVSMYQSHLRKELEAQPSAHFVAHYFMSELGRRLEMEPAVQNRADLNRAACLHYNQRFYLESTETSKFCTFAHGQLVCDQTGTTSATAFFFKSPSKVVVEPERTAVHIDGRVILGFEDAHGEQRYVLPGRKSSMRVSKWIGMDRLHKIMRVVPMVKETEYDVCIRQHEPAVVLFFAFSKDANGQRVLNVDPETGRLRADLQADGARSKFHIVAVERGDEAGSSGRG